MLLNSRLQLHFRAELAHSSMMTIKRAEIWTADLRNIGIEISKVRPVLIVSVNYINKVSPIAVVLPLTSKVPQVLGPERVLLSKAETGLRTNSIALSFQIRALDKSKLVKKVGCLKPSKMSEVEESIKIVLGLIQE